MTAAGAFSKQPFGAQPSLVFDFERQPSGSAFSITGAEGEVAVFEVPGACRSILFSADSLQAGAEYSVSVDSQVIATAAAAVRSAG